jgi:hypothetical protein
MGLSDNRQRFLRVLLESRQLLLDKGFGIPTTKISNDLGVDQTLISRFRRDFVACGWLVPVGNGYTIGRRAKCFKASGSLKVALEQLYPRLGKDSRLVNIPARIEDGAWNQTLGVLIGKLYQNETLEQVLARITGIEGADQGDRMAQAERWYNWYCVKRETMKEAA